MIEKKADMRKLRRSDLIDIIYELQKKVNFLEEQNKELIKDVQSKEIIMENAGSIAEAALVLNGVFETAQKAADQYLTSIKSRNANVEERAQKIISEAHQKANALIEEGKNNYIKMKQKGEKEYREKIAQSEAECEAMRKQVVESINLHDARRNILKSSVVQKEKSNE